ncbi:AAA family ATPase [Halomontanus rarus]|uniref:AAA family ATPase n=1 Tax=Halomontanus rarus TaxID=3034020 RepID=UPI0023E879BC|nr:AAA family ATPase [Halovivax sp. TS33]
MIKNIHIQNYRSVSGPTHLEVDDMISILIGANEAGKTNLLRAISRFGVKEPILPQNLSNYKCYDSNSYDQTEILRIEFSDKGANEIEWLGPPYDHSDINYLSEQNYEVDSNEDSYANPSVGELLKNGTAQVVCYASGDHSIHFALPEEEHLEEYEEVTDNFPMPLDEFRELRKEELKQLGEDFIAALYDDVEWNYILDKEEVRIASVDDVLMELGKIEERFDSATFDEEAETSISEDDEATFDISSNDIAREASKLNARLSELVRTSDPTDEFPRIINQMDIELADSKFDLVEDQNTTILQGLFAIGNIRISDYSSYESERLKEHLEFACEELSRYLNSFWSFDYTRGDRVDEIPSPANWRYEVECELENTSLTLYLNDNNQTKTLVNERSDGMRWILTFLLSVLGQYNSTDKRGLVLMDDPGIHLHPEAEKKLYRSFYYIVPEAQVIFSTHSPILIDGRNPDQLRIVKHTTENGTKVYSDIAEAKDEQSQIDLLSVVRESLGWYMSDFLFGGEQTLLVEGSSDKRYLELFNQFFSISDGKEFLNQETSIVDGGGDRITFLSRILGAEDMPHILLLDDDKSGKDYDEEIQSRTLLYQEMPGISQKYNYGIEIEDLIEPELLVNVVIGKNPDLVDRDELLEAIEGQNQPVMEIIERELEQATGDSNSYSLDKGELSKEVCSILREDLREGTGEFEETAVRFEKVISSISQRLEEERLGTEP